MQHDEFVGTVQQRARLDSRGAAQQAIRATLETLRERLPGGTPSNIGAQLPEPIGAYLGDEGDAEQFDVGEFYRRVCERESTGTDLPEAVFHAKAVMSVVREAVRADWETYVSQLPADYSDLFDFEGATS